MNLSGLLPAFQALREYAAARLALSESQASAATDPQGGGVALALPRAARAPVSATLAMERLGAGVTLVVAARNDRALTLTDEIAAWAPACRVLNFMEPTPLFYEQASWGAGTLRGRIGVLAALAQGAPDPEQPLVVVASARALMARTLPRRDFLTNTRSVKVGQTVRLEKLLETWVGAGYSAETIVVQPGQFSRRGGIVDIFPVADALPARIELFGDDVDTIRRFNPATQRSGEAVDAITVTPAREGLPRHWKPEWGRRPDEAGTDEEIIPPALEFYLPRMFPPASLLEYLPPQALVLVDDWQELAHTVSEFEEQALQLRDEQTEAGLIPPDFPEPYHAWADLQDELTAGRRPPVFLGSAPDEAPVHRLGARFHPGPRYGGQLRPLLDHLFELHTAGARTVVVTRQAQRLAELWGDEHGYRGPVSDIPQWPAPGSVAFVPGALTEGWWLEGDGEPPTPDDGKSAAGQRPPDHVHLLTDAEVFGWARPEPRRRRARPAATAPEANYADFAPGDLIVHADHGIGRFRELVRREIDGLDREYLLLEYAEGDELYVPIFQTDRITRYVGADDHPPALSRLGSTEWQTVRTRTQQAVEQVAKEMLQLYARRELAEGRGFGPDTPWQAELEASFPYVETEDQLRAIRAVKTDMERGRPMDRLICGDVGYGKTEVALRAAFKAVMDGAQVAILVPTTVLAQQHYHTFGTRLAPYPVKVEMLSRFRSSAEARQILQKLEEGHIDILIGTHRLLQKDVRFKNLGLLIIDEEQRFGITHKERLKQMRTEVDVLTLTATPIPRTLYMSLTGVRDISTINTPPEERLPILTHTGPYNEKLVRQAILRELDRGGQVFYVHNRVQSIGIVRQKLEKLAPEARIGVGHGQMDEHELERVMDAFTAVEIDVLLCTSIIESGLDIPNANTLIVDRADTFGLAQLYQLRGRVGRGAAQAYAYFFTDRHYRPTPEGRERLETIAEQTELGAGYSIAMRDLEMRGAGDILGPKQSGHISAVGFHLYTRLLAEAVRRLKAQGARTAPETDAAPEGGPAQDSGQPAEPAIGAGLGPWDLGMTVSVDLPIGASIPADYVPDRGLRLQLYRRLANLGEEAEVESVGTELADRFGPLPRSLENLLFQLRVKIRAARAGVTAVSSESGQIVLTLPALDATDQAYLGGNLGPGLRVSKNRIWLGKTGEPGWRDQLMDVLAKLAAERATLQPRR